MPEYHPAMQVPELPVYGVAIPTVSGMRLVLDELGAAQGLRNACCIQDCLTACIHKHFIHGTYLRKCCRAAKGHVVQHARGACHLYQWQPICHADTLSIAEVLSIWLHHKLFVPNTSIRLSDNWLAHNLLVYCSVHTQTAGHTSS